MAKVIPASLGKIDVGLPAQGVWYPHFWGLPLATRCPPQWPHKNCQHPLCPPPGPPSSVLTVAPLVVSKPLNNIALRSALTNEHHQWALALKSEHMSLRLQLRGLRAQLASAMMKSGRLRKDVTAKDMELHEKLRTLSEVDDHLSALCNYLVENGIVVNEDEITNQAKDAPASLVISTNLKKS